MNIRSISLLAAVALSLALSASPTLAGPKAKESSSQKAPATTRSSKPKEIVVVGSRAAKSRSVEMNAWLEAAQAGN